MPATPKSYDFWRGYRLPIDDPVRHPTEPSGIRTSRPGSGRRDSVRCVRPCADLSSDRTTAAHGVGADLFAVREDRDDQGAAAAIAFFERSVGAIRIGRLGTGVALGVLDETDDAAVVVEERLVKDGAGHRFDTRQGLRRLDGDVTRDPLRVIVGATGGVVRITARRRQQRQQRNARQGDSTQERPRLSIAHDEGQINATADGRATATSPAVTRASMQQTKAAPSPAGTTSDDR